MCRACASVPPTMPDHHCSRGSVEVAGAVPNSSCGAIRSVSGQPHSRGRTSGFSRCSAEVWVWLLCFQRGAAGAARLTVSLCACIWRAGHRYFECSACTVVRECGFICIASTFSHNCATPAGLVPLPTPTLEQYIHPAASFVSQNLWRHTIETHICPL